MAMKPVPKAITIVVVVAAFGFGLSQINWAFKKKEVTPVAEAPIVVSPPVATAEPIVVQASAPEVTPKEQTNVTNGDAGMSALLKAGKKIMGCYVNPKSQTKEAWLLEHGEEVSENETQITEDKLPVCLVDNGMFRAAGVAFCEEERQAFLYPDGRVKFWFMVDKEKLRLVSDLDNYER